MRVSQTSAVCVSLSIKRAFGLLTFVLKYVGDRRDSLPLSVGRKREITHMYTHAFTVETRMCLVNRKKLENQT